MQRYVLQSFGTRWGIVKTFDCSTGLQLKANGGDPK